MRNLIYQCHNGAISGQYPELSIKSLQAYANRHGIDYRFDHDQNHIVAKRQDVIDFFDKGCRQFVNYYQKMHMILDESFDIYDNIMYADTDVLACRSDKNIFNIPFTDIMAVQDNDIRPDISHRWNAGVVVFSRQARQKLREEAIYWEDWIAGQMNSSVKPPELLDEWYLNDEVQRLGLDVKYLGKNWNIWYRYMSALGNNPIRFVHFSNWDKPHMAREYQNWH